MGMLVYVEYIAFFMGGFISLNAKVWQSLVQGLAWAWSSTDQQTSHEVHNFIFRCPFPVNFETVMQAFILVNWF